MQIDYHHAVTYVIARFAGFDHAAGETISQCAQYVDEAVDGSILKFHNHAMYTPIPSAHKMLDYRNFDELANHYAWLPFHFLPGNELRSAEENFHADFERKVVCKPDSPVARDMVAAAFHQRDLPNALHRLGVTLHVYADTFAHQGFAGISHAINNIDQIDAIEGQKETAVRFKDKAKLFFGDLMDEVKSHFVEDVLPLGHGAALCYPDLPYLKWQYVDANGEQVIRDNTKLFLDASNAMFRVLKAWQQDGNIDLQPGLTDKQLTMLESYFKNFNQENSEERHRMWIAVIQSGAFGFDAPDFAYHEYKTANWNRFPIEISDYQLGTMYRYTHEFISCNWKMFQDALHAHRYDLLYQILPRYGIVAA